MQSSFEVVIALLSDAVFKIKFLEDLYFLYHFAIHQH